MVLVAVGWSFASDNLSATKDSAQIPIRLHELLPKVVARNISAYGDYLTFKISDERITAEKGIFEPVFQALLTRQKTHIPNTTEDILTRQASEYWDKSKQVEIGFAGLLPTGAQWSAKLIDNKKQSSTIEKFRSYKTEYDDALKLSIEQPLLRGFGFGITMAKIDLAKTQRDIDYLKFEQKLMELSGVTIQLYWKLYGAKKIADNWETSYKIALDALKDLQMRHKQGRVTQTEVLEAQTSVLARKGEYLNAKTKMFEAQSQLMTLLNTPSSINKDVELIPIDLPFSKDVTFKTLDEYLNDALQKWPEYKAAEKDVEREKIQVKYAFDQVLPKLDIVATASSVGLASDNRDAYLMMKDNKFVSWSAGIRLTMPVIGNVQAMSGLSMAKMKLHQSEMQLQYIKTSLSNSIAAKLEDYKNYYEQVKDFYEGLDVKQQLIDIERQRFKAGKINLRQLFEKEEDFVNYQRKFYSTLINFKLAEAALEIATGEILVKYGVDPKSELFGEVSGVGDLKAIFGR